MVYDQGFNLESFKTLREESKNTLLYTLLLPDIVIADGDENTWIEQAINGTFKACHRKFFRNNYDFFGFYESEDLELASIIYSNHYPDGLTSLKGDFFSSTILSQCIMSSYDTVMHLILSDFKNITSYTLCNKIEYSSYNELKRSNIISDKFTHFCGKSRKDDASYRATLCKSKVNAHLKCLRNTKFQSFFPANISEMSLFQSDILYRINDFHSKSFMELIKLYTGESKNAVTSATKIQDWNQTWGFYTTLMQKPPENHVDHLYYSYRIEKIFNLNLASCMIKNMNYLSTNGNIYLNGVNDLKTLSLISRLPNVFSRTIYLQFALDSAKNHANLSKSFFDNLDDINVQVSRRETREFNIHEWNLYFEKFCNLFTKLIFPVFEWYFFLTLLETAEKRSKDTRSALLLLQKILYNYIENNHDLLLGKNGLNDSSLSEQNKNKIFTSHFIQEERTNNDNSTEILRKLSHDFYNSIVNIADVLHNFYEIYDDKVL